MSDKKRVIPAKGKIIPLHDGNGHLPAKGKVLTMNSYYWKLYFAKDVTLEDPRATSAPIKKQDAGDDEAADKSSGARRK